jgi:hypothetical protein
MRWHERAQQRGEYWLEHLSPGQLRGEPDEWAIVYHEGENALWLLGQRTRRGEKDRLFVPSGWSWDAQVPPWAQGRREVILDRVRRFRLAARCELIETAG